jgi:hypothetical protein
MRLRFFLVSIMLAFVMNSAMCFAQDSGLEDREPLHETLGAPLYPGSVFIRIMPSTNPYTMTAMYISLVPVEIVEDFFNRKLVEKRSIFYSDKNIYLTAYLLKTWSKFPNEPTLKDLPLLEAEPSVQLKAYDPEPFKPLADYYFKNRDKKDNKEKVNVLENGKTMILYTYAVSEEDNDDIRIIGLWKESSRDLPVFFGSTIDFKPNGVYTVTYTPDNIAAMAKSKEVALRFNGKNETEIKKALGSINPEKGKYIISNNTITMFADNPIDGIAKKSGLAKVTSSYMSLELITKPRLTFIKNKVK